MCTAASGADRCRYLQLRRPRVQIQLSFKIKSASATTSFTTGGFNDGNPRLAHDGASPWNAVRCGGTLRNGDTRNRVGRSSGSVGALSICSYWGEGSRLLPRTSSVNPAAQREDCLKPTRRRVSSFALTADGKSALCCGDFSRMTIISRNLPEARVLCVFFLVKRNEEKNPTASSHKFSSLQSTTLLCLRQAEVKSAARCASPPGRFT